MQLQVPNYTHQKQILLRKKILSSQSTKPLASHALLFFTLHTLDYMCAYIYIKSIEREQARILKGFTCSSSKFAGVEDGRKMELPKLGFCPEPNKIAAACLRTRVGHVSSETEPWFARRLHVSFCRFLPADHTHVRALFGSGRVNFEHCIIFRPWVALFSKIIIVNFILFFSFFPKNLIGQLGRTYPSSANQPKQKYWFGSQSHEIGLKYRAWFKQEMFFKKPSPIYNLTKQS